MASLAPAEKLSPLPLTVTPTPQELSEQRLSWRNLELATRALHRDGLVVIENAVEHAKLDVLNQKMVQDALVLQSAGDNSPYNFHKGSVSSWTRASLSLTSPTQKHPARSANDEPVLRAEHFLESACHTSNL